MWSDSHSGNFSRGVRAARLRGIEGCVGHSVDTRAMKIQKTLRPESNEDTEDTPTRKQ